MSLDSESKPRGVTSFYPVFDVVEVVAAAGLVVFEGKATPEATVVVGHYSVVGVDGFLEIAVFSGTVVEIVGALDVEHKIVGQTVSPPFCIWSCGTGPLWAVRPCEGVRGGWLDNAGGVSEEVRNGHAVQVAFSLYRLHLDKGNAQVFGCGCRNLFGVLGHVGGGFVGGGVKFDNGLTIVEGEIMDGVGVNCASDVLSHGGYSFSVV